MTAHHCRECGAPFEARRSHGENIHCSVECRKAFNNRRMTRGAQLYDLWMIVRYERGLVKLHGLVNIINRLAFTWREEDKALRAGRKSWREYDSIHHGLAPLRVTPVHAPDQDRQRIAVENGIASRSRRAA